MAFLFENTVDAKYRRSAHSVRQSMSVAVLGRMWDSRIIGKIFDEVPSLLGEFVHSQGAMMKEGKKVDEDPRHRHRHWHDAEERMRLCDFLCTIPIQPKKRACLAMETCMEYCWHEEGGGGWDSDAIPRDESDEEDDDFWDACGCYECVRDSVKRAMRVERATAERIMWMCCR